MAALTGYEPQDLIEKTLYQYIHATDMVPMRLTHLTRKYFLYVGTYFCTMSCGCSAAQGPGEQPVLPVADAGRGLGVGAELRHHRAQLAQLPPTLHRRRQLRPQVSGDWWTAVT